MIPNVLKCYGFQLPTLLIPLSFHVFCFRFVLPNPSIFNGKLGSVLRNVFQCHFQAHVIVEILMGHLVAQVKKWMCKICLYNLITQKNDYEEYMCLVLSVGCRISVCCTSTLMCKKSAIIQRLNWAVWYLDSVTLVKFIDLSSKNSSVCVLYMYNIWWRGVHGWRPMPQSSSWVVSSHVAKQNDAQNQGWVTCPISKCGMLSLEPQERSKRVGGVYNHVVLFIHLLSLLYLFLWTLRSILTELWEKQTCLFAVRELLYVIWLYLGGYNQSWESLPNYQYSGLPKKCSVREVRWLIHG